MTQTGTPVGNGTGGFSTPVVLVIGVPAAEPDSLVRVLTALPADAGLAVVLAVQHREALDEEGLRRALGERAGALAEAADGVPLEAGRVYLPAPDQVVTLEAGRFRARPAEQRPGGRATIDNLFVSLAQAGDGHVIGVVLAGTGRGGTLGVAAIKENGGFVLAEAAENTDPVALAASNNPAALADLVLPAEEIAARVALHARHVAQQSAAVESQTVDIETTGTLHRIAAVLRERTGHDFHGYKRPTFLRRVQRRMGVVETATLDAYLEVLRAKPDEAQQLFNDLLIGVTRFFRDRREFEFLEREVVPKLFAGKGHGDQVRVWVLGCSTGEEAYSIAILLREFAAALDSPPVIQIFATDLDGRALAVARAGRYKQNISEDVSPERLARWFVEESDTYAVVRELRDACVFSQHSLVKDVPFSRLDLISCRNLLIYLGPELQDTVIPLFHFALNSDRFLFLGTSEGVARHTGLFAPADRNFKVFRRLETARRILPILPTPERGSVGSFTPPRLGPADPGLVRRAERLVERQAPAYAVVDGRRDVLHLSARAGRFIHPAGGAFSPNLLDLVHADLRLSLRAALDRAAQDRRPVRVNGVLMDADEQGEMVDLVVEPIPDGPQVISGGASGNALGAPGGFVVLFNGVHAPPDAAAGEAASGVPGEQVQRLEGELRVTRERLQATVEELEGTNEELRSSNEEYQSLNEELQSANEELATSKEEMQSLNEELTTVNHELAHRVDELGQVNSDLRNLLQATQIATVFLDTGLRVASFTPAAAEVFHLVETDLGRPIAHIKARVAYDGLQDDVRRVLRTLGTVEREVEDPNTGARYIARVLPYRSVDNVIAGAVMVFTDVTPLVRAQEQLRASEERLRLIVGAARDYAIFVTDPENRITDWMPGAEAVFGWTAEEAVGQPGTMLFTLDDRAQGESERELEVARWEGAAPNVRWHMRRDGSRVFIQGTVAAMRDVRGELHGFLKIGQDVTERRLAEERLARSEALFRTLATGIQSLVFRGGPDGARTWDSPQWADFTGLSVEDSIGSGWLEAVHPEDRDAALAAWRDAAGSGRYYAEHRIRRAADGEWRWHQTRARSLDGAGKEWVGAATDVHELRELHERQGVLVAELQHRTRNLLAVVRSLAEKTMAGTAGMDEFREHFRDRLSALSRVQGLLSRLAEGERVTFDELIRAELHALGALGADGQGPQVALDGPEGVRLRSSTVQTFALALHELATNALKYGALLRPESRLRVAWRLEAGDGSAPPVLHVDWQESGVAMPEAGAVPRGYGRELIERALPYQLAAQTHYELGSDGVHCTISLPVSAGRAAEEPDRA